MSEKRVLLVDDEADILKVMGVRIKSWGYDLSTARNAREAIEAVKAGGNDIIILDYMLPDMDGVEVLRNIRKINKKVPVIMFTAYPNTQAMNDSENLGISAFVAKLSSFSDTQELLKTAIDMALKKIEKKN